MCIPNTPVQCVLRGAACHHVPRVLITQLPTWSHEAAGRRSGYLHLEVINSKDSGVVLRINSVSQANGVAEKDVTLELADISLEETNTRHPQKQERHPPFAFKEAAQVLRVPDAALPPLLLQAYEDELLRDSELPEVADFADEDSSRESWSVLMDAHVAKICLPVS